MKRFSVVLAYSAVLSALAFGSFRAHAEDAKGKCGDKGQPSCPLQGWMEKNVDDPMSDKDLATVAKSLEKVAKMAPDPKWNDGDTGWAKIARSSVSIGVRSLPPAVAPAE